jgi:hypothetical protein
LFQCLFDDFFFLEQFILSVSHQTKIIECPGTHRGIAHVGDVIVSEEIAILAIAFKSIVVTLELASEWFRLKEVI